MRKLVLNALGLLMVACLFVVPGNTQETPPEKQLKETVAAEKPPKPLLIYRVDFAVHEVENGKRVNTRNYTMLLAEGGTGRVRVGGQVPVAIGPGAMQVQYMDVGLSIDCRLEERENYLTLRTGFEIRDLAPEQEGKDRPLLRTVRSDVDTAIPPGKPTLVSALDDTATKRRYELEVTATKIK